MSWYVGQDGRQVWAERDDTVFTVGEPEGVLPMEILMYLSTNTQKAVYQEHTIDEDEKKGKKAKGGPIGKQRGFLVRVDQDDRVRISSAFQAGMQHLMSSGVVTRVDVEDNAATKRKGKSKVVEVEEVPQVVQIPVGINECRVDTVARCQHQAHGVGFRLDVAESDSKQRLHVFTGKELSQAEWHTKVTEAIIATGGRVMLGRLFGANAPDEPSTAKDSKSAGSKGPKRDVAKEGEDAWLDSLMGRCMVVKDEKGKPQDAGSAEGDSNAEAKKSTLPPWLKR